MNGQSKKIIFDLIGDIASPQYYKLTNYFPWQHLRKQFVHF